MIMKEGDDYCIQGLHIDNKKELVVCSRFLSYSKEWPKTIDYNGKTYKFDGKSPLPDCYANHYFSMALYLEQEPVTALSTDSVHGQH